MLSASATCETVSNSGSVIGHAGCPATTVKGGGERATHAPHQSVTSPALQDHPGDAGVDEPVALDRLILHLTLSTRVALVTLLGGLVGVVDRIRVVPVSRLHPPQGGDQCHEQRIETKAGRCAPGGGLSDVHGQMSGEIQECARGWREHRLT